MIYLYWIIGIYLFLSFTYLGYLGMARLNIARKTHPEKLTIPVYIFGVPALLFFAIADVIVNILMSVVFLQLPRFDQLFFTARLSYNANHGSGYRKPLARWFCRELLDRFDFKEKHCSCWDGDTGQKCEENQ